MSRFIYLIMTLAPFAFATPAFAIDCGSPPPVADVAMRGRIGAEAQILSKKLGTISGNAAAAYTRQEVYSRYPNADKAAADRYFQYEICSVVNADPKLTTIQRIKILADARRQFKASDLPRPSVAGKRTGTKRQQAPSRQNETSVAAPQQPLNAAPINENLAPVSGNQYNAGTMYMNASPERRKYLPGLQDIYSRGSSVYKILLNIPATNESVDSVVVSINRWLSESQTWLQVNMTTAAANSLTNVRVGGLVYGVGTPIDGPHQRLLSAMMIQMPQYLENVRFLMYSNTFDPQ